MYHNLLKKLHQATAVHHKQLYPAAAAFLLFLSAMFSIVYLKQTQEALSSRIAPEVLRFHVLANSDRREDQELKLEVKQLLIETIYEDMSKNTVQNALVKLNEGEDDIPFSKEAISVYISENRMALEEKAEAFMASRGFPYSAAIQLETCYFSTRIYGDVVFPCGTYDAVRVLLGDGAGKNWWCVLYPPLCFTDNATAIVPDTSKAKLQNLLSEDDYHELMKNRRVVFGDGKDGYAPEMESAQVTVHVRSKVLDLLTGRQGF